MAYSVQIILNYIKTCIKVCITLITTLFTTKPALTSSISPGYMSTFTTPSTRITSRNMINQNSFVSRFVFEKFFQLIIRPTVMLKSIFLSSLPGRVFFDTSQFLKNKCGSWLKSSYYLFGNNVINITSKTVLFGRNLPKVPFPRMSFGLKFRPQTLISFRNLFDVSTTKKSLIRSDSKFLDASVTPNEFSIGNKIIHFFFNNNMQKNLIVSNKQISTTSLPRDILLEVGRNNQFARFSSFNGRERNLVSVPPYIKRTSIVPDTNLFRLWARGFLAFFKSLPDRFKSFGGFHTSRYSQLRRKIDSGILVNLMMQRDPIVVFVFPSYFASMIKRFCVSIYSGLKDFGVFLKSYFDCSDKFHTHILYPNLPLSFNNIEKFSTFFREEMRQFLPTHKGQVNVCFGRR